MKFKYVFFLLSFTLFLACQTKKAENKEIDSAPILTEYVTEVDTSLLKGIWWESKDAPTARFVFNDTTVYIPDQETDLSEFKYSLIGDSLKIFKPNMAVTELSIKGDSLETYETFKYLTETYKVEKLTKDTLILSSEFEVSTLIKIQE